MNKLVGVIIPLLLGIVLSYFTYVEVGKVFFLLFIVMFIVSFKLKDLKFSNKDVSIKKFFGVLIKNKKVKHSLWIPFLSGLTYSSGVMGLIITLSKINNFKTNLNLGFVDSLCAVVSLSVLVMFTVKIKKERFNSWLLASGIVSALTLTLFAFVPSRTSLIIYLFVNNSFIALINRINNVIVTNLSNSKALKSEFKTEYYLFRYLIFSISRASGYIILMITCLVFGMEYINYLMIICAISIIVEAIIGAGLNKKANT